MRPAARRQNSRCWASNSSVSSPCPSEVRSSTLGVAPRATEIISWPLAVPHPVAIISKQCSKSAQSSLDPQVFCQTSPPYIHAASRPLRTHLTLSPLVAAHTCPDFSLLSCHPSQPPRHGSWLATLRCFKTLDHPKARSHQNARLGNADNDLYPTFGAPSLRPFSAAPPSGRSREIHAQWLLQNLGTMAMPQAH